MVKIEIDISAIRNEVAQIHSELYSTNNMTDTQRRDTVKRLVERLRTFKNKLEDGQLAATLK